MLCGAGVQAAYSREFMATMNKLRCKEAINLVRRLISGMRPVTGGVPRHEMSDRRFEKIIRIHRVVAQGRNQPLFLIWSIDVSRESFKQVRAH